MIKKLWQLFFPAKPETAPVQDNDRSNQTNLTDQSDRLLRLESEIQTLRLTLNEKEQLISKLRTESDRQRQNETRNQAIALQTQQEQFFTDIAAPVSQLLTQIHLLEVEGKPVQAKDVISVVKRILRILEEQGLTPSATIGETIPFDPNLHQPLSSAIDLKNGQTVKVRLAGLNYQGKVLKAAGVEPCLDD